MKRVYWLLLLFAIWCLICGIWYMFAVQGISRDLHYFNPHPLLMAIAEVLVMVLIACLLGYAIGWALREGTLEALRGTVQRLDAEQELLIRKSREAEQEATTAFQEVAKANKEQDSNQLQITLLTEQIIALQQNEQKQSEASVSRFQFDQLTNEAEALRFRIKQLEFQIVESEETILRLGRELEAANTQRRTPVEPLHPFVRPIDEDEKDDLTKIKGIGPFIEKRLNMLGIYTFQQIAEFTPEVIEYVTKAIEFFPNRMVRDNWVEQAKRFTVH